MNDMASVISTLGLDLAEDQKSRHVCPFCNAQHEKSLTLFKSKGIIHYKCWRVKCGVKGRVLDNRLEAFDRTVRQPKSKFRKFKGSLYPFGPDDLKKLESYGISEHAWNEFRVRKAYLHGHDFIHFPIFDYKGEFTGSHLKQFKPYTDSVPKCLTFIEPNFVNLYFPRPCINKNLIYVVEDPISAIKLSQCVNKEEGVVALLGTMIGKSQIKILRNLTKNLVIALDNDAIQKSYQYVNKYSLYFDTLKVLGLQQDVKDMSYVSIIDLLDIVCGELYGVDIPVGPDSE